MKVTLQRVNSAYHFEAKGASGIPVQIDNKVDGITHGSSPMELLLMGVGGCSAIDVISILNKQRQEITAYDIEVIGERMELKEAKPFKAVHVVMKIEGDIAPKKAIRAAQLSFKKYCSVTMTLQGVAVTYDVILNNEKIT